MAWQPLFIYILCFCQVIIELNAKDDAAAAILPIEFENVNVASEYHRFKSIVKHFRPHTIVHLAEQRAAPYSMKNERTRMYTVDNNINATHNCLNAIVECDREIHLVHLGTMGVYGYGAVPDTVIPEGYVKIKMQDRFQKWGDCEIMHPYYPGSVYHTTKCLDNTLMSFYAKNYNLQITDLHQGIVWGLDTNETKLDKRLINRLDCDSDYGTVLNRFIIQAACNKELTVYGTGEQTRAFIHIQNSMECMELAIDNPPKGRPQETPLKPLQIFNQMTETHRLLELVEIIKAAFGQRNRELYGRGVQVKYCQNPRKELVSNDLQVSNDLFLGLGLVPIGLRGSNNDGTCAQLVQIYDAVLKMRAEEGFGLDEHHLNPQSFWSSCIQQSPLTSDPTVGCVTKDEPAMITDVVNAESSRAQNPKFPFEPIEDRKRVIVLGGDGFCGWPLALHLSRRGYQVLIVDNLSRRAIDKELKVRGVTPIASMAERLQAWREV